MEARPNVVLLINDQHAHDVLGCAGFGALRTPTADGLARDGVRFTQAVCAATPCLPSRHSLFHGLHPFQSGILRNGSCMDPALVPPWTMGKAFADAGCLTAAFGKMHWFPYGAAVPEGSWFGFARRAGHFHESGELMESDFVREHRPWAEQRLRERAARGIGMGGDDCAAAALGYRSELRLDQRQDWWSAGRAADFIAERPRQPFLLVCSLCWPHSPHDAPADYWGRYDPATVPMPPPWPADLPDAADYRQFAGLSREDVRTAIANYMACVEAVDACQGRVVEALKRAGLYDSTLIVHLADHGELLASRSAASFSKYNLYERAIRVPLIIKPPAGMRALAPGTVDGRLVSLVDILPTVLDLAGIAVSDQLPGISLAPAFRGENAPRSRRVTVTQWERHLAVRTPAWKLIRGPRGDELYDLVRDPSEFRNLAGDGTYAAEAATLAGELAAEIGEASARYARLADRRFARGAWSQLAMAAQR